MSARAPIHKQPQKPSQQQQAVNDDPAKATEIEQTDYALGESRYITPVCDPETDDDANEERADVDDEEDEVNEVIERSKNNLNRSRSVPRTPERQKLKPVASSPISPPLANYSRYTPDTTRRIEKRHQYTTESTTVLKNNHYTAVSTETIKRRSQVTKVINAPPPPIATKTSSSFSSSKSLMAAVVLVIIASAYFAFSQQSMEKVIKYCKFDDIRERYARQDEFLWKSLSVGIENILNKHTHSPGIFLFVHELEAGEVNRLVKDIAKRSTECFGEPMQLVELKSTDFLSTTQDYGATIQNYRKKMENGHVLLVANLNQIPPKSARALHAICDTVTPLKEDIVIFLTLTTPKIKGNIIELAENSLFDLWNSSLKRYELDPLITRVTDQVFALRSS